MENKKGRSTSSVGNGLATSNDQSKKVGAMEGKDSDSNATNQPEQSEVELGVLEQNSYIVENNVIAVDENAARSSSETQLEIIDDSKVVDPDTNVEIEEENNQIKIDSNASEEFEIDLDEGMTEDEARMWRKRFVSACR